MTVHLLDVNLLVALTWPDHVLHGPAQRWFGRGAADGWATSSATEAGFLRVSLNRKVVGVDVSWAAALDMLRAIRATPGHEWWGGDVDLLAAPGFLRAVVVGHRQVTDVHLVAVAAHHGGRLATLDRRVSEALHPDDRPLVTLVPPT